jgi:hypothetical protein
MDAATNPVARPQFIRDLLDADIYALNQKSDGLNIQGGVMQEGTTLNLLSFQKDGTTWLPIFTSLQRVEQFIQSNASYVQLKARDFFEITRGTSVFLNPGFSYGKELLPQEIQQMLDGSIFQPMQSYTARHDSQVLIGQPAVHPHALTSTLSAYFARNPRVHKAYLVQYHDPQSDEKPHLLIAIDGQGDWPSLLGDAGMIASEMIAQGEVIDFIRLDRSGFSRAITKQTQPFYRKPLFGNIFG